MVGGVISSSRQPFRRRSPTKAISSDERHQSGQRGVTRLPLKLRVKTASVMAMARVRGKPIPTAWTEPARPATGRATQRELENN
eukprot:jgi/Tetstr1/436877/TSEL_025653.t1